MLFNLTLDPEETINVVAEPQYRADIQRMSAQLAKITQQSQGYLPLAKAQ